MLQLSCWCWFIYSNLIIDYASFYSRFSLAVNEGEIEMMTTSMHYAKIVIKKRRKQRLKAIRSWSFGAAPLGYDRNKSMLAHTLAKMGLTVSSQWSKRFADRDLIIFLYSVVFSLGKKLLASRNFPVYFHKRIIESGIVMVSGIMIQVVFPQYHTTWNEQLDGWVDGTAKQGDF